MSGSEWLGRSDLLWLDVVGIVAIWEVASIERPLRSTLIYAGD